jgi:hypothetical protein
MFSVRLAHLARPRQLDDISVGVFPDLILSSMGTKILPQPSYDIWGSWSPGVGSHAPLNDMRPPRGPRAGSALSVIAAWDDIRRSRSRIVLGVPAYGRSETVP